MFYIDGIDEEVPCGRKSCLLKMVESVLEPDEIGNVTEETDRDIQINLEMDNDGVRELLDTLNQEVAIDELIEIHKQKQDIKELESLDLVQ
ncbi:hypothetical protein TNCV_4475661 [Trichonephila clavipes]|nr:hypothetical protein TNCV_4475661 [Trichonephila clavipes]